MAAEPALPGVAEHRPDDQPDADPESVARSIVLRRLAAQPRSRAELADALRRRHVADDVAEHVLDRFTEVGLVDDAAFAESWVQSRHAGRGLARRALADELRRRGVDAQVAADALDQVAPGDEEAAARALVERRLSATERLDPAARTRRLVGLLARRGYPAGLAARIVREVLDRRCGDDLEPPDPPEPA